MIPAPGQIIFWGRGEKNLAIVTKIENGTEIWIRTLFSECSYHETGWIFEKDMVEVLS